ncbi:DMT family transporter [Pusillimonas sp. SM2304]|uniref:DMT family transporter n=1 Tax=Pusillimonas sp. SM2304 TaxID=3073241 RepID=UPI002875C8A0|nr:DMT family transporter [Pusillimonas sp. SM2304]MDS1138892.1 DMT family transporter [Pusillimonas sp. SM2304]
MQTLLLSATAMLAFAANSVLCRLALDHGAIDPASFGSIRLLSGALILNLLIRLQPAPRAAAGTDWPAALMLFAYVACFSFAYLALSTGTGALILFGAVQLTMIACGLWSGERFGAAGWLGLALALGGLVYLLSPGVTAPPLLDAGMMAIAGIAWGAYSLRGRHAANPLAATARNFALATPFALALSVALAASAQVTATGIGLALASGALTSGLGYVIWYAALPKLSAMRAATMQLSVPLIATIGGVLFVAESVTPRLAIASAAILGGIAFVLMDKSAKQ